MRPTTTDATATTETAWAELSPAVEDLVRRLRRADREATVLRFYRQLSFAEVAAATGTTEEAARKRVGRAVERLREMAHDRGLTVAGLDVAAVLWARAGGGAAPADVAAACAAAATAAKPAVAGLAKAAIAVPRAALATVACAAAACAVAVPLLFGRVHQRPAPASAAAAATAPVAPAPPAPLPPATQAVATPPGADEPPAGTPRELLYVLRHHNLGSGSDWMIAVRDLSAMGPAVVPDVAAELDRATGDSHIRALAMTLRVIGDARGVPALIRALPRTNPRTSDFLLPAADPVLREFMRRNGVGGSRPDPQFPKNFGYARAVRQIRAALEELTGHTVGADYVTRESVAKSRAAADRWGAWWAQNRARLVPGDDLPAATVPAADEPDPVHAAGATRFGELFPAGPGVKLTPVREVELVAQRGADSPAFFDFETGARFEPQEGYVPPAGPVDPLLDDGFGNWLQAVGVDVWGSRVTWTATKREMYAIQESDVRTWPVDDRMWDGIDAAVTAGPAVRPPGVGDGFEPRARKPDGEPVPATFLFITREGGRGIFQLRDASVANAGIRFRYRMWDVPPLPGLTRRPAVDPAATQPAQQTAMTFGPDVELFVPGPDEGAASAVVFRTGELLEPAPAPTTRPGDQYFALLAWMDRAGADAVSYADGRVWGLRGRRLVLQAVRPEAWAEMTPSRALEVVRRRAARAESAPAHDPSDEPTLAHDPKRPAAYVFRARDGTVGLLQLTGVHEGQPAGVTLRYKVLR